MSKNCETIDLRGAQVNEKSYPIILSGFNNLKLIVAWWRQMATEIWVNIGLGNSLLPDGTKPFPEPMLTEHHWIPVTFILGQFC